MPDKFQAILSWGWLRALAPDLASIRRDHLVRRIWWFAAAAIAGLWLVFALATELETTGLIVCLLATLGIYLFARSTAAGINERALEAEQLEAALVDAEAASEAKKNFLASMSHELRTPLNAIIGFSDIMHAEALGPIGNGHYKQYAKDIREAGRHLLSIVGEILDTARIEHGAIELGTEPIDTAAVMKQSIDLLAPVASAKRLVVKQSIAADLPPVLMAKVHLNRVLFNLVGNAIKFTPAGGEIEVLGAVNQQGDLEIAVDDRGIGIPRHRIQELFTPFTRIDDGSMRSPEGTGLGLVNCKLVVEAYGGRIWIDSDTGRGTKVTFTIPRERIAA